MDVSVQLHEPFFQCLAVLFPSDAIDSRRRFSSKPEIRPPEQLNINQVHERCEPLLLSLPCCLTHTVQPLEHAFPALRPARA
jgi:hypothetical protein